MLSANRCQEARFYSTIKETEDDIDIGTVASLREAIITTILPNAEEQLPDYWGFVPIIRLGFSASAVDIRIFSS